jgi:uncharacterized membrane protein YhaH (DUF805 family)
MDWLSFKGKINRKQFVFRVLSIWIFFAAIFYLFRPVLLEHLDVKSLLVFKSVTEIVIILLCVPSIVKRLREIKWPVILSLLFIVSTTLNIRTLILLGVQETPFIFYSSICLGVASIVVLLFLVFKRGISNSHEELLP